MTAVAIQKLNSELQTVKREVRSLRSLVIGMAVHNRDAEGEYLPEFVKRILSAKREKAVGRFTNTKSFLAEIRQT